MKLQVDMKAPGFSGETLEGHQISLEALRGKNLLLKFYRYASCPVCNLHVQSFVREYEALTKAGLTTVMVFHSSREYSKKNLKTKVPFDLVADPEKHIFRDYGVEASWRGMFSWAVIRDYAKAIAKGLFSIPRLGKEGGHTGHPADFLIDGEGIIRYAHYGKHYSDSITANEALRIFQDIGFANA